MGWNAIYDEVKKHTDLEGLKIIKVLQDEVVPVENALRNGDMVGVAKIMRKILPYTRQLIPHLNNKNLQKSIQNIGDDLELNLIKSLEADGAKISVFDSFIESESNNLGGVLKSIVHLVGKVVDKVLNILH